MRVGTRSEATSVGWVKRACAEPTAGTVGLRPPYVLRGGVVRRDRDRRRTTGTIAPRVTRAARDDVVPRLERDLVGVGDEHDLTVRHGAEIKGAHLLHVSVA